LGFLTIYSCAQKPLASIFLKKNDNDSDQVLNTVQIAMPIMAVGQVFDAIINLQMGALRGVLDLWWPCIARITMFVIPFLIAAPFVINEHENLTGICIVWTLSILLSLFPLTYRFNQFYSNPETFKPLTGADISKKVTGCISTLFYSHAEEGREDIKQNRDIEKVLLQG